MWMLTREQVGAISKATLTDDYKQWTRVLRQHLFLTRLPILRSERRWLWAIQNRFLILLNKLEKAILRGKQEVTKLKQLAEQENDPSKKQAIIKRVRGIIDRKEVNERLRLSIKTITDGIAWRNMRFDRNIIRVLAEGNPTGHVETDTGGGKAENYLGYRLTEDLKHLIIRNDLTNFLRIGDLTEIDYPAVFLHEVKSRSKKDGQWRIKAIHNMFTVKKGQHISSQTRRLLQAQRIILEKKATTPEGVVEFVDVDIPFKTYFSQIRRIIRKARRTGYACIQLDDCFSVECQHWEVLIEKAMEQKKEVWRDHKSCDGWTKEDKVMQFSNYDSFTHEGGQFIRNSVPYAVFPLSVRDCTDLLMGNILLKSRLSLTRLIRRFEEAGWEVELQDFEKINAGLPSDPKKIFSGNIFDYNDTEKETLFFIKRPPFNLGVSFNWVHRVATEFMTVETLLNFVDHLHKTAVPYEPRMVSAMFKQERKLWR